jgi:hypothetical protein
MNCPICQHKLREDWKYCPECGVNPKELENPEGYSIQRIRDFWADKGGGEVYKNFESIEQVGTTPYKKTKPIRPTLGDFIHLHFSNLYYIQPSHYNPNSNTK